MGFGERKSPVGSRCKAPVGRLGDEVPQELKQNVKLAYNFFTFFCTKFRI